MNLGIALTALVVVTTPALAPPPAAGAAPTCLGQVPTIVGTEGDDRLVGTPGPDVIAGLGGIDRIEGGDGDDVICGGDNALVTRLDDTGLPVGDSIAPGPGNDVVDLGLNTVQEVRTSYVHDVLDLSGSLAGVVVDLAAGTAVGEGSDTLVVPQPDRPDGVVVRVDGSVHPDVLLGTERADLLIGHGGGDRIEGRGGDDLLIETVGDALPDSDDVVLGGPGADGIDAGGGDDVVRGGGGGDYLTDPRGTVDVDGGPGLDRST